MATAYVSFGYAGGPVPNGQVSQIRVGSPDVTETVTTSGTAAASANAALADGMVSVFCDTALYMALGSNPTVTPTTGWHIPASTVFEVGITKGQKISLIDV